MSLEVFSAADLWTPAEACRLLWTRVVAVRPPATGVPPGAEGSIVGFHPLSGAAPDRVRLVVQWEILADGGGGPLLSLISRRDCREWLRQPSAGERLRRLLIETALAGWR
jgi:hypothetical protein